MIVHGMFDPGKFVFWEKQVSIPLGYQCRLVNEMATKFYNYFDAKGGKGVATAVSCSS